MMRVLWLCSIPLPKISEKYNIKKFNIGSWIEGMKNTLISCKDIQLGYVFPSNDVLNIKDVIEGILVYSFSENDNMSKSFEFIIKDFNPDIVHIFGTENPYTLEFAHVYGKPNSIIVNIQGLAFSIAKHYSSGVPDKVRFGCTLRDCVKRNNIETEISYFKKCSIYEKQTIKYSLNFIGRTEFDKAAIFQLNPKANYYHCNETLRPDFYSHTGLWSVKKCKEHSIFMSQAQYPVKGIHFVVEAMSIIKEHYPDVHLYVAGSKIRIIPENKIDFLMQNSYARYVWKLIKENKLENNITFLGSLSPKQMIDQFLNANAFVSSSTIENESNSISEAKLLGTPVVASYVGGVISRIKHNEDGFLYQHDAAYMLAYYVEKIFSDKNLATKISSKGVENAKELFSVEKNKTRIIDIYKEVANNI